MNILFTCGGTAGHVNPAVALARIFQERNPGCRVLFVGADGGMETRLVPKEGYPIETVTITNFHRSLAPADIAHNFGTLMNMQKSKGQARRIVDEFKPDLVVGTGGYASFPVVKEAARRKIPHRRPRVQCRPRPHHQGPEHTRSRVWALRRAAPTTTTRSGWWSPAPRCGETSSATPGRRPGKSWALADDRPLLLSYWGSLGAEVMNRRMVDFLEQEAKEGAPFRHIHGAGRDFNWMQEELLRRGVKLEGTGIEVREYIYDMPLVMAAADVVVCRAGASTISELTAIAKPSILVPSPNVTANHQEEERPGAVRAGGAAVLLLEKDCPGMELYDQASALLRDPARRDSMIRALNSMAVPDAGGEDLSDPHGPLEEVGAAFRRPGPSENGWPKGSEGKIV